MPRIRSLKPSFFTHEVLGELSPLHRLLYAGLWCHADRNGNLENRPRYLKTVILPYDEGCDVGQMLADLAERGFIRLYEVEGERYIHIPKFVANQKPHAKETAVYPPPPAPTGPNDLGPPPPGLDKPKKAKASKGPKTLQPRPLTDEPGKNRAEPGQALAEPGKDAASPVLAPTQPGKKADMPGGLLSLVSGSLSLVSEACAVPAPAAEPEQPEREASPVHDEPPPAPRGKAKRSLTVTPPGAFHEAFQDIRLAEFPNAVRETVRVKDWPKLGTQHKAILEAVKGDRERALVAAERYVREDAFWRAKDPPAPWAGFASCFEKWVPGQHDPPAPEPGAREPCRVAGCADVASNAGICGEHFEQWRKSPEREDSSELNRPVRFEDWLRRMNAEAWPPPGQEANA